MYQIRDAVLIKDDLSSVYAAGKMLQYEGHVMTIVDINDDGNYIMLEDKGKFFWTDDHIQELFMPMPVKKPKKQEQSISLSLEEAKELRKQVSIASGQAMRTYRDLSRLRVMLDRKIMDDDEL